MLLNILVSKIKTEYQATVGCFMSSDINVSFGNLFFFIIFNTFKGCSKCCNQTLSSSQWHRPGFSPHRQNRSTEFLQAAFCFTNLLRSLGVSAWSIFPIPFNCCFWFVFFFPLQEHTSHIHTQKHVTQRATNTYLRGDPQPWPEHTLVLTWQKHPARFQSLIPQRLVQSENMINTIWESFMVWL